MNMTMFALSEKIRRKEVDLEELSKIEKVDIILNGAVEVVHRFSVPISVLKSTEFQKYLDMKEPYFKYLPFQYNHKFEKETAIKSVEFWLGEHFLSSLALTFDICEKIVLVTSNHNKVGQFKLSVD